METESVSGSTSVAGSSVWRCGSQSPTCWCFWVLALHDAAINLLFPALFFRADAASVLQLPAWDGESQSEHGVFQLSVCVCVCLCLCVGGWVVCMTSPSAADWWFDCLNLNTNVFNELPKFVWKLSLINTDMTCLCSAEWNVPPSSLFLGAGCSAAVTASEGSAPGPAAAASHWTDPQLPEHWPCL